MIRPTVWQFCFLIAVLTTGFRTVLVLGTEADVISDRSKTAQESNASHGLVINRFCLVYTPLGPVRPHKAVYPGEHLGLRAEIIGLSQNAEGEIEFSFELQIVSSGGERLAAKKQSSKGKAHYDRPARFTGGFKFPSTMTPGKYFVLLTFTDLHAKSSRTVVEVVEVKTIELAVVSPRFFHDNRGHVPAPCGGFCGQSLTVEFSVIGESITAYLHNFDVLIQLFDEHGDEAELATTITMAPRPRPDIDMKLKHSFQLQYAGDYTMRWTVTERSTGKTATHELPLVVLDPLGEQ